MNSTTYLDEQIAERQDELIEMQGETLAVQYPELLGTLEDITLLQLERDRLMLEQERPQNKRKEDGRDVEQEI